jgi:hypothetical protein
MEPRFGWDFSQVRVHTDERAARSTQDLSASAYTVGHNIVFGAGRFQPDTQAGRHLLSHELAHVIQQQDSSCSIPSGVGAADDFHERQADSAAESISSGGSFGPSTNWGTAPASQTLQRQPQPQQAKRPLRYDRAVYSIPAVPQGQNVASVKSQLDGKVKQQLITSYVVKGATGNAEVFLLSTLFSLADDKGSKRWGTETDVIAAIDWAPKGGTAPLGQITVRIDWNGVASAELIARGVPAASIQTTANDLKRDFNLFAVSDDGSAKWLPAELNDVASALALLPGPDKAALVDVELIRVAAIKDKPTEAGDFDYPHPAATAPERAQDHATLKLTNKAFDHEQQQFFGGTAKTVPAGFEIILHEVGHAVESLIYREKWREHAKAIAEVHAAGNIQESPKRKQERQDAENKLQAAKNPAEKKKWQDKILQWDLELARLQEKAQDQKTLDVKLKDKEKEVLDMDKAGQTQRLAKFMTLVHNNHIDPITDYAKTGDNEFYAEAYSLWLVDREFLQNNYPVIFKFFVSGDYRN